MRQFAVTKFVQDLARLGVTVVVALRCLVLCQNLQSTGGEFRIYNHRLQRNDQGVAAEQSHEPWQSRGWHEHHVIGTLQRKPQCCHILYTLIIAAIKLLVAGLDFQNRSLHSSILREWPEVAE